MELKRKSNVELCRIISIILVMLGHFYWTGSVSAARSWEDARIIPTCIYAFAVIGVNVFILITGYFSTFPKKKSILNLLYICLFYGLLRIIYDFSLGRVTIETLKSIFFVSSSNWFIPKYLGLLLLTPILNSFVEKTEKKTFLCVLLSLYIFQWWFDQGLGRLYRPDFGGGYSILSFSFLYLLGRYYRLYGISFLSKKWICVTLYFGLSLFLAIGVLCSLYLGWEKLYTYGRWFSYANPIVILSSLAFLSFFTCVNIETNKGINYISKSTLGVLLFHAGRPIFGWMQLLLEKLYNSENEVALLLGGVFVLMVYFAGVLVDQVRIYSYKFIEKRLNIIN